MTVIVNDHLHKTHPDVFYLDELKPYQVEAVVEVFSELYGILHAED